MVIPPSNYGMNAEIPRSNYDPLNLPKLNSLGTHFTGISSDTTVKTELQRALGEKRISRFEVDTESGLENSFDVYRLDGKKLSLSYGNNGLPTSAFSSLPSAYVEYGWDQNRLGSIESHTTSTYYNDSGSDHTYGTNVIGVQSKIKDDGSAQITYYTYDLEYNPQSPVSRDQSHPIKTTYPEDSTSEEVQKKIAEIKKKLSIAIENVQIV